MLSHVLGFPRIGKDRQLKRALEAHWRGETTAADLEAEAALIREDAWRLQAAQGLGLVAVGDFSLYDHILDTAMMVGAVPRRFGLPGEARDTDTYFRMARGDAQGGVPAMEMTKWFDTNYHYIVPELDEIPRYAMADTRILDHARRAAELGHRPKAVLVGPATFLSLAKAPQGADRWEHLLPLARVYAEAVAALAEVCPWIQIDEPVLCADLGPEARTALRKSWALLHDAAGGAHLLLAAYFGPLGENLKLAQSLPCHGLHVDLCRGRGQLDEVLDTLPEGRCLSLGLVDGRNIWKNDLDRSLGALRRAMDRIGEERVLAATSCSLLHCPVDLDGESALAPELRDWMAFAVQKCGETALLARAATGGLADEALVATRRSLARRAASPLTRDPSVRARTARVDEAMRTRTSPFAARKPVQDAALGLPPFPTTTIGSFPQTPDIRRARLARRKGEMDETAYTEFVRGLIKDAVDRQEGLDLDVLVHGEPERNDMVEYFGQQMKGFCFTRNGWVQSYGSRCVKPPVIYGDVSRPEPMTVDWITYAQGLTAKPMKGMITGPVTILNWSFVRDDMPRAEVCAQIALAMRDEVADLEKAGIRIIQIDEAALREGLPLRAAEHETYLRWAVDCFRVTAACVADATQIHTHMCYSEFNSIVEWIARMDADVISIEASRSGMDLLSAFEEFEYPNDIGPGVYDIHSPRVPGVEEILDLLRQALEVIPAERLWVNPDCGLKTRGWAESTASLKNMVAAAKKLRTEHGPS
ncbi:5-methyltetrahydropteroyltriglutamate--homocysteine S-methyltransferase [Desulfocurvus sp. DL9XJH121]